MAKLPFVVVGDGTTGGGKVIGGSPGSTIEGKPIARVGDMATCPINGHGGASPIVTGDDTCLIDGRPAARHNDSLACGCKLMASQGNVTTGDAGGGSGGRPSKSGSVIQQSDQPNLSNEDDTYDQYFQFVDESGQPIKGLEVTMFALGQQHTFTTDSKGKTAIVSGEDGDEIAVKLGGGNG